MDYSDTSLKHHNTEKVFSESLDKQMLDLLIKSVFGIAFILGLAAFIFGHTEYALINGVLAGVCVVLYLVNQKGFFKPVFWVGITSLSLTMVYYTYHFGFINSHLYLLAGIVILSYFNRNTKYVIEFLWGVAGLLFVIAHYFLKSSGKISDLGELEELLFYPNVVLSMVLLYLATNLYRKKQQAQRLELHESIKVKDKLLSILSHDLRTPFGNLQGIIQLIEMNGISKSELDESLVDIKANL